MGQGPRARDDSEPPASPGGQPGPSPVKPARPPQRTTCGRPRVSHIWRPTQSWSGMLLRRRFVAGPAPRSAPLGTPANEATSTHTGSDDYYDGYYYEPPARRPRLRCLCASARYDSEPRQAWGPPQLAPTTTTTVITTTRTLCLQLRCLSARAHDDCTRIGPLPSTATTTSSRNLQHIHTNGASANLVTPMAVTPSTGPSSFVLRSLSTRKLHQGAATTVSSARLRRPKTSPTWSHQRWTHAPSSPCGMEARFRDRDPLGSVQAANGPSPRWFSPDCPLHIRGL
jgi:hypothetical protein